jgi:hypothetical protein
MARLRGCYNDRKAAGLPELLVGMHVKARLQVETALAEIGRVSEEAVLAGINLAEVRE